jgi:hypothetical protein
MGDEEGDDSNTVIWRTFKLKEVDKMKLRLTKIFIVIQWTLEKTYRQV